MERQEILAAFLQAEKDWSEPIERAQENCTYWGLCAYFVRFLKIDVKKMEKYLKPRWIKYKTCFDVLWDFYRYGDDPEGRTERLDAIKKVINDLQNES